MTEGFSSRGAARGRLLLVGLVSCLALACVWVWATNARETSRFQDVVTQFEPPPEWLLLEESQEPARKVCLGDVGCPSARLRWELPRTLTPAELRTLFDRADWRLELDDECGPVPGVVPRAWACDAHGTVAGYRVRVSQRPAGRSGRPEVSLVLEGGRFSDTASGLTTPR